MEINIFFSGSQDILILQEATSKLQLLVTVKISHFLDHLLVRVH